MEGVGGTSGNNNSCNLMAFGEQHNHGFSPMMIMMPPADPNTDSGNNGDLFFSLPNSSTSNVGIMLEGHNMAYKNSNNTGTECYFMDSGNNGSISNEGSCSLKAKIMAHPHYHRLLAAFVNCQKIGAPPEVAAKLEEARASAAGRHVSIRVGQDPALDQFMEAYCEMLNKYEQELSKPFREAMLFLERIESQFKALKVSDLSDPAYPEAITDRNIDGVGVDMNSNALIDSQAEERELKGQLLRRYSGYLGGLKKEFMKERKKGKLPKEARQQLLDWWSRHYKWPYPSESQKVALGESTGLDQKQINNWFINQRKRHWKPSEDMQFVVMTTSCDDPSSSSVAAATANHHPHNTNNYYHMEESVVNVLGNPFPMDFSPALL